MVILNPAPLLLSGPVLRCSMVTQDTDKLPLSRIFNKLFAYHELEKKNYTAHFQAGFKNPIRDSSV